MPAPRWSAAHETLRHKILFHEDKPTALLGNSRRKSSLVAVPQGNQNTCLRGERNDVSPQTDADCPRLRCKLTRADRSGFDRRWETLSLNGEKSHLWERGGGNGCLMGKFKQSVDCEHPAEGCWSGASGVTGPSSRPHTARLDSRRRTALTTCVVLYYGMYFEF